MSNMDTRAAISTGAAISTRAAISSAHGKVQRRLEALDVVSKQMREVWRVARRHTPRSAVALACMRSGGAEHGFDGGSGPSVMSSPRLDTCNRL